MTATVAALLARAAAAGLARLDAQLLLAHVLGRDRTWVLAHDEAALAPAAASAYVELCARRGADEPLAYLVGTREFHGLSLRVTPAVLVPRPETETLVERALELLRGPLATITRPEVADLGTGSGAIALAVKHRWPAARICAVERSPPALEVARGNGEGLRLEVEWLLGHWWQPLHGRRLDLVLSNPPYVAAGDGHLQALRHEPMAALVAGPEGLDAIECIAAGAGAHLRPGGWLLLEHGFDQAPAVQARLNDAGFDAVATTADLAGRPRCTEARWPGSATN